MVVVPIPQQSNDPKARLHVLETETEADMASPIGIAAGGTLVAGGLLLLAGRRRAGTIVAATGAALALLDQQDAVQSLWRKTPGYIDAVNRLLGQVQEAVENVAAKRESIARILGR